MDFRPPGQSCPRQMAVQRLIVFALLTAAGCPGTSRNQRCRLCYVNCAPTAVFVTCYAQRIIYIIPPLPRQMTFSACCLVVDRVRHATSWLSVTLLPAVPTLLYIENMLLSKVEDRHD
ncbi:hypothetical protein MTO96_049053 [Rhipicephalus appendiculatus]